MHRQFRAALRNAIGDSKKLLVAFVDVREFSKFSKTVESVEAALFIKKAYERMLDVYFPTADFFKPTGDGLMVIFELPFDISNDDLRQPVTDLLGACLRLVDEFPDFVSGEAAITFEPPKRIGIGLALGAACKLTSDGLTLDYSGSVLNLAARLMDYARPEGIVIDGKFGLDLLPPETRSMFASDEVYVRGITEATPAKVYFLTGRTTIPVAAHERPDAEKWETVKLKFETVGALASVGEWFTKELPTRPVINSDLVVIVRTPKASKSGRRDTKINVTNTLVGNEYVTHVGDLDRNQARLDMDKIRLVVAENKAKPF